ncbi:MAG: SufS family cysteine desulfurase [Synechococcaceae cyanobacterium RM1_1_27]|nr:SufS family cysteine desulfurase [Synechococcaceae cyanobacterium SM2_3_2]NJO85487.1 SufS family cysteine desulfurase [Synechococcaceae cyanobacterium RM1_1_27]
MTLTSLPVSPVVGTLPAQLRQDFPVLTRRVHEQPLVYLDNAATSQKPEAVLVAMEHYYRHSNANVHRGVHTLSNEATDSYEGARSKIATFLNAQSAQEIVYTRNASEAINLVAYTWGMSELRAGDQIILSRMEHHSNLVPWQLVAQRTGALLKFVEVTPEGQLDLDQFRSLLNERTKLVSIVHVSNMLGSINPVESIIAAAHAQGARVLLDACQSVPHMGVDVQALDCDWLVFSSHKMCGPTGMGILYGKRALLEAMPPFMGGGEMIADVFWEHSTYADLPHKFEAGTPAIAEAVGLGAAVDYLTQIGIERIHQHEQALTQRLLAGILAIEGITVYGPQSASQRAGLVSFAVEGIHAHDLSTLLDNDGIAIRAGHHCTQPLHRHLGVAATARASVYLYNTLDEVDTFLVSLQESITFFRDAMA